MKIGCVKEIKKHEYRVGLTPSSVVAYVKAGHSVMIEKSAGEGAGFSDQEYVEAGASIVDSAAKIWADSEMIIKVKEPLEAEYKYFREDLIIYTYLHLAADKPLTEALLKSNVKAIAYETIQEADGSLPCLKPMSEIAGRLSAQEGAKYLEKPFGGRGVLLGGVPGVERGKVAVIGGGVVGLNAAKMAVGLGADVTILDVNAQRLAYIDDIFGGRVSTLYSNEGNVRKVCAESDVIIGAVLIPGKKAPKVVRNEHMKLMKKGAVMVDVAVDQGGCFEITKATYHDDPVFIVDGIVCYCVANMPGAVARTSTVALTGTTLSYGLLLAQHGVEVACSMNKALAGGLNVYKGKITCKGVADAFDFDYHATENVVK
ncbi:MAG: alanine dehydrogenase [Spirochaetales bacterium]|nr:alanine dehydrogenase [Spirochaetales bacterium]